MKELKEFIIGVVLELEEQKKREGLDDKLTKLLEQLDDLNVKLNLPVSSKAVVEE